MEVALMVIIMKPGTGEEELQEVRERVHWWGLSTHVIHGVERVVIGVVGDTREFVQAGIETWPGVDRVVRIVQPYKLASKEVLQETRVRVGEALVGGEEVVVMAGPCAVESYEQMLAAATAVGRAGARVLRGGAYKPRTSPYSFQGLAREGLELLRRVKEETGLPVVTEVMEESSVELVAEHADLLQVGARNMQNYPLLRAVGRAGRPVLLKRGMAATVEEWLLAAEYILSSGNPAVILCERGIRTFEPQTRNTLDLSAIPLVKRLSHLPVVADPSHATGDWRLVGPLSRAAVAAGADGLLIEVHPRPDRALCDGSQSLTPRSFASLMKELAAVAAAVGRHVTVPTACPSTSPGS